MTQTLFELAGEELALQDLLSEIGGDVTEEEAEKAIDAWFSEIHENRNHKLDAYVFLIAEFEARAEVRRTEAQRITSRARVDENAVARLKTRLRDYFQLTGIKSVETDLHRITLAANGGKAPLILSDDINPGQLPEECRKVTVSPDKDAIRAKLEQGEELDFAHLGARGQSIRIK